MATLPRSEIDEAMRLIYEGSLPPPCEELEEDQEEWEPPMTPSQREFYYDDRRYLLAHGERGSGKSIGALHRGVKHCYLYDDALYLIVTITRTGGLLGGAWENLVSKSRFIEGPLTGQPTGILETWREGISLEYGNFTSSGTEKEEEYYRDDAKNLWVDIRNIHGGISRIVFKSMLNPSQLVDRIKDIKPSLFHMEELTNTHDPAYFTAVVQQLGRRASVPGRAQQWMATCNPASTGQKHWVFNQFFVLPHTLKEGAKEKVESHEFDYEKDVIEHHPDYGVHHVKMTENEFMPEKELYIQNIYQSALSDPTEVDRAIHGKWVPKISGNSLFWGYWDKAIHVKGNVRYGFDPIKGLPIVIGYDPGNVNNARVLMQRTVSDGRAIWRIFDCSIFKQKKIGNTMLVKLLMDKMLFWCERMDYVFTFYHISDRQALDEFNPYGSYDWKEYYLKSKDLIARNPKYAKLSPIRMQAPPKGADSVRERVLSIKNKLLDETLFVSGCGCEPVIEMFEQLKKAKDKVSREELDDKPLKTTDGHIHTFDGVSYPVYFFDLRRIPAKEKKQNSLAMVSG